MLRVSNTEFSQIKFKISENFLKKSQLTSHLENYKDLQLGTPKITLAVLTTGLRISNYFEKLKFEFSVEDLKESQKSHILRTRNIGAVTFGGNIRGP